MFRACLHFLLVRTLFTGQRKREGGRDREIKKERGKEREKEERKRGRGRKREREKEIKRGRER